jgi:hypothetical protein
MSFLDFFRRKRSVTPTPENMALIKIGGRVFSKADLTPELIDELKREYLLPTALNEALARVNLSATCPEQHNTIVKVGVFTKDARYLDSLISAMQRNHASVNCTTCGKRATVSGKQVAWTGPMKLWDGI